VYLTKKIAASNSAAADDISGESMYMDEYTTSQGELVNLSGITTDKNKELPASIRTKLSLLFLEMTLLNLKLKDYIKNFNR